MIVIMLYFSGTVQLSHNFILRCILMGFIFNSIPDCNGSNVYLNLFIIGKNISSLNDVKSLRVKHPRIFSDLLSTAEKLRFGNANFEKN